MTFPITFVISMKDMWAILFWQTTFIAEYIQYFY
mgnify:CR=1 FL=1